MAKKKATKTSAAAKKKVANVKTSKTTKKKEAKKKEAKVKEAKVKEPKKKKAAKKKVTKRKSRAKGAVEVRKKIYWGVFNHAMKRVALYEFNQRKAAEKRAKELSPEGKPPHFVQKIKEEISA